MNPLNSKLKRLILEVGSIVLGVLLALGVNEWREQRSHRREAAIALERVLGEVRSNREILQQIHDHNTETLRLMAEADASDAGAPSGEAKTGDEDPDEDRTIVPGLQLRDTAWEAMLTTGASNHVDFDRTLVLSETYAMQRLYRETALMLTRSAMNMTGYAAANGQELDNESFKQNFRGYFEMLIAIEEQLLKAYAGVVEQMDG